MALAVAATEAAAGLSRSEHWNVNTLIPHARQRESPSCPDVPCERRTSPADPTQEPNTPDPPTSPDKENSRLAPSPTNP
jgi:hypothetical protein